MKVMRKYLGTIEEHTMFKGECMGQVLWMELLRQELKEGGEGLKNSPWGQTAQAGMQALQALHHGQSAQRHHGGKEEITTDRDKCILDTSTQGHTREQRSQESHKGEQNNPVE